MKLGKCDYTKLTPCIKSSFKTNRFPKKDTVWLISKNYRKQCQFFRTKKKRKNGCKITAL